MLNVYYHKALRTCCLLLLMYILISHLKPTATVKTTWVLYWEVFALRKPQMTTQTNDLFWVFLLFAAELMPSRSFLSQSKDSAGWPQLWSKYVGIWVCNIYLIISNSYFEEPFYLLIKNYWNSEVLDAIDNQLCLLRNQLGVI